MYIDIQLNVCGQYQWRSHGSIMGVTISYKGELGAIRLGVWQRVVSAQARFGAEFEPKSSVILDSNIEFGVILKTI